MTKNRIFSWRGIRKTLFLLAMMLPCGIVATAQVAVCVVLLDTAPLLDKYRTMQAEYYGVKVNAGIKVNL